MPDPTPTSPLNPLLSTIAADATTAATNTTKLLELATPPPAGEPDPLDEMTNLLRQAVQGIADLRGEVARLTAEVGALSARIPHGSAVS